MPIIAPSVLSVGLCLLCISVTASTQVFTSITGRDVPVHFIQEHFSKSLTSSDFKADLLYELTKDQVLLGPGLHIDLRKEAHLVHVGTSPFLSTLDLNGKRKEPVPAKINILRARNYDVILDKDSGQALSVSGNGIALVPLHQTAFPGIFVNKRALSKYGKNMSDDFDIIPQDDDEDRSTGTGIGVNLATHQSGGSCASGTTHYVEIAVAYDNTFCALYGNVEAVATAAMQSIFDRANVPYAKQTCVQLALVHVEAHCEDPQDPFASFSDSSGLGRNSPSGVILDGFQRYWRENRSNVRADVAYIFTGFDEGTAVAGRAALAATCNIRFGYGWVEGPDAKTFAHEVGHTLSGTHTATGLMKGIATPNDPFVFSSESVRQFTQFLDRSPRSNCVETSNPKCDSTCPVPCTNNKCVQAKSPPPGLVPCTPIQGFYKCTFTRDFSSTKYYFTEDCPKQYNFIERKFDPNDLSIFCCTQPTSSARKEVVPAGVRTSILNVNLRNGRFESFRSYLRDTSSLATMKLIKSTLVSSCRSSGVRSPPAPITPRSTEAPPVAEPTPRAKASPRPQRPQRPVGEEGPSAAGTCESGFTRTRALSCLTRDVGMLEIQKSGFDLGRIKVSLQQTNGEFRMRYGTRGRSYIREYRELVTTMDEKASDFVSSSEKRMRTRGQRRVIRTKWDANSMELPDNEKTCCGKNVYIAVDFRLCMKRGPVRMCGTSSKKFSARIRCRNFCRGKGASAVLVPMSQDQKCASCE